MSKKKSIKLKSYEEYLDFICSDSGDNSKDEYFKLGYDIAIQKALKRTSKDQDSKNKSDFHLIGA